eukprot:TRINITY_DN6368_c0_g1_i4.p1 TRINITY_DN6368_c0_g1~~TRINITY_DN6368_c0_g1_i4.p1  ORF type:complete len:353 (+),score=58.36 TRINITY_DN6368_c0_g1_i4:157-1059(+)
MESGLGELFTERQGMEASAGVVANTGCSADFGDDEVKCMRSLSPQQLIILNNIYPVTYPTMHPYEFTSQPVDMIKNGQYNQVQLLIGANHDEGSLWTYPYCNASASAIYPVIMEGIFGEINTPILEKIYPTSAYSFPGQVVTAATSDSWFKCRSLDIISALASSSSSPSPLQHYLYSFEHQPAAFASMPCLGVAHSFELFFLFPNLLGGPDWLTDQERKLSAIMRSLWVSYISSGKPAYGYEDDGDAPQWPSFDTSSLPYLVLDLNVSVGLQYRQPFCQYWDKYPSTPFSLHYINSEDEE